MNLTKQKMKKMLWAVCQLGRDKAHLDEEQFQAEFKKLFKTLEEFFMEDMLNE